MTILCLFSDNQRLIQANLSFKQSLKLGLKDIEILEEIGDLYYRHNEFDQSLIAYQHLVNINSEYADGLRKYAEVLEDPRCRNQNIDLAIDYLKKALHLTDGDQNKHLIAVRMEKLYKKMGRDNEIKEIQKYLDQDKQSGGLTDEEDDDDDGSLF